MLITSQGVPVVRHVNVKFPLPWKVSNCLCVRGIYMVCLEKFLYEDLGMLIPFLWSQTVSWDWSDPKSCTCQYDVETAFQAEH